jgi:hypothetical protein
MNIIEVILRAKDLITPKINGIKSNANGMAATIGNNMGGLVSGAANTALGMAITGYQHLSRAINDASKSQIQALAQAGDFAEILGINFQKAQGIVDRTQMSITKLAASLPGETQDFNLIFDQISATVARGSSGDIKAFEATALDITKRLGVLAYSKGASAPGAGSAMNRAISGSLSLAGLRQLEVFEKNPLFMSYISEELKKAGLSDRDFQKISQTVRTGILQKALKRATSDSTLAAFEGTVDAMIQDAKTSLFDPRIGLFGVLRKIPELNNRTIMDSVQGAMKSYFNFWNSFSRQLPKVDPMAFVGNTIDFMGDIYDGLHAAIAGQGYGQLKRTVQGSFDSFQNMINVVARGLENIDWEEVGEAFYKTFVTLMDMIANVDRSKLMEALIKSVFGLAKAIGTAITKTVTDPRFYKAILALSPVGMFVRKNMAAGERFRAKQRAMHNPLTDIRERLRQAKEKPVSEPVPPGQISLPKSEPTPPGQIMMPRSEPTPGNQIMGMVPKKTLPLPLPSVKNNNSSTFSPVVNVTANSNADANDIARLTMERISQAYSNFRGQAILA